MTLTAAVSETTLTYRCNLETINIINIQNPGGFGLFNTSNNSYRFLDSNKPVLVTQLGPVETVDGEKEESNMAIIASFNQYLETITFVSPSVPDHNVHYINIISTANDTVLMDGQPLSLIWNNIYDNDNNTIGYGAQVQATDVDISHIITTQSNAKLSILVYGYGHLRGYAFNAGFDLNSKWKWKRCNLL